MNGSVIDQIEQLRSMLHEVIKTPEDLHRNWVLQLSQELDALIVEVQQRWREDASDSLAASGGRRVAKTAGKAGR